MTEPTWTPDGVSIYAFLRSQSDEVGRLPDGLSLPDERPTPGAISWAPGAMDGVMGHHAGAGQATRQAGSIAELVVKACGRPTKARLRRLYRAIDDADVLAVLDPTIERVVAAKPQRHQLHDVGRWLATTATDRGAVKVGIALLGVSGLERDVDVVRVLGAHDEFTLYAAVALKNGLVDPDSELWALAAIVDGWGRIQCVEALSATEDPAIRGWILREGYRNSIMYEYLAYIAATTGGLVAALQTVEPDRSLLTAAGEILGALVMGGPARDLHDYEQGAEAVEAYLSLMRTRAETIGDFQTVTALHGFLEDQDDWDDLTAMGWTATRRSAFEAWCDAILADPRWDDLITVGLLSTDSGEFHRADEAARRRGIDTYEIHKRRIMTDPLGSSWFRAWQQADSDRAAELAQLAVDLLPLEEIASGPADELGLGQPWRAHGALDWTLQALRDHPGVGQDLVMTGLRSPVTRNRNMALHALKEWPTSLWPVESAAAVADLRATDPNAKTQEFAGEILQRLESGS
ncbi:hypothetical protein F0U44_17045 [Nocardioides humilatus]|uniref:Limonene hydroxylase n=1 Tax=Nocardioides humilatus TaxID=2607660 RepID=A0A5B1L875_9ACTN|nr:hypothetical protein [Nocardioides humilatus]KAA1416893.1 hypothetical protein F0U44_17045 [Nocardioides humilatus]